jgi:hypothetical protein
MKFHRSIKWCFSQTACKTNEKLHVVIRLDPHDGFLVALAKTLLDEQVAKHQAYRIGRNASCLAELRVMGFCQLFPWNR